MKRSGDRPSVEVRDLAGSRGFSHASHSRGGVQDLAGGRFVSHAHNGGVGGGETAFPGLALRRRRLTVGFPPEETLQGAEYIRWVQASLNRVLALRLPVNGILGPETRSAVRRFQERERLPVTGIVGPDTERALIAALAGVAPAEPARVAPAEPAPAEPAEPEPSEGELDDLEFAGDFFNEAEEAELAPGLLSGTGALRSMYVRTRKGHGMMGGSTVLGRPPASNKGLGLQASEGLGQVLRACPKCERFKVGKVAVWSLPAAVFFNAGMAIDADGAPNAYHPLDKGLDYLKNAGFPPPPGKRPWGIVIINGRPVIQGSGDPFPGYFVSGTSLVDKTRPQTDTRRYVDSAKIPYIALPGALANKLCVKLGDFAAVVNPRNQRLSYAIFADIGPAGKLGEGSIALAQSLGHNPFVRGKARNGMADVIYVVFPGSGDGKPRSIAEIASNGERLFVEWGGMSRLFSCFPQLIRDLPVPSPSKRYA